MALQTGMDFFAAMPLSELIETIEEVHKIGDERKRIQAGR